MTAGASRGLLLAVMERQRRPRVVPPSGWAWAKAWARRWWRVTGATADQARALIAWVDAPRARRGPPPPGVIADCGRNARGGPAAMPVANRKEPAVHRARA